MEKKKTILLSAAVVMVAVGGFWMLGSSEAKSTVSFATENVKKSNISNSITATGTIEPVTEVEVGTQVSGIIDKIYVDYNSVVTKGELIAEMDKITLQSELQSARATYDGNKAEYDYQRNCTNATRSYTTSSSSVIPITNSMYITTNVQKALSMPAKPPLPKPSATFRMPPSPLPLTEW